MHSKAWVKMSVASMVIAALPTGAVAGDPVRLQETFDDLGQWDDLSTVVDWDGDGSAGASMLRTTGGAVTLDPQSQSHIGFGGGSSRMFQALDHQFAEPIDRTPPGTVVDVRFRARWDSRPTSDEGSRLVVALNHDYPEGGLDLTREGDPGSRFDDFTFNGGAAWARPAYNLRIRLEGADSLMMFGGGRELEGEYEPLENNPALPDTWLPGFSQAPGGPLNSGGSAPPGSPDSGKPGVASAGVGSWSQSEFRDYLWRLTDTEQLLFFDADGDGIDDGDLVGRQDITGLLTLAGEDFQKDFPTIEGIRLFWRGSEGRAQAMVDSLSVTVVPEPATGAMLLVFAAGLLGRRRGNSVSDD